MILLRQARKILLTIGLIFFISTVMVFSVGSGESWAATSSMQGIDPLHTQIATMDQAKGMAKDVGGKIQTAIDNLTDDPNNQVTETAEQFEAKTREGNNNSIINPDYQTTAGTKQAKKQARKTTEDIKAQVRDAF